MRGRHVRCEVTGHRGEGIDAHPDATVLLEETSVSGDEDDVRVRAHTTQERPIDTDAPACGASPLDELLAELDGMVGLEGVKKEVRSLVNLQQAGAKREACTDDPFFGFACSFNDTV